MTARLITYNPKNLLPERCEDVKNRCLILLSVDRFSDFLADKSNIINRALASQVLVNVYELSPNLAENLFIYEHLLNKEIRFGWEPKQAVFFLLTKILEAQTRAYIARERRQKKIAKRGKKKKGKGSLEGVGGVWESQLAKNYQSVGQSLGKASEKESSEAAGLVNNKSLLKGKSKKRVNKKYKQLENLKLMEKELEFETYLTQKSKKFAKGPVLGAGSLQALLSHIPRVLNEHEEIAEACCELLLEVLKAPYLNIKQRYWQEVQAYLNPVLQDCEDISYLPKSTFEFLSELIAKEVELDSGLVGSLPLHLNKFMFHDNFEVRSEVYRFVFALFSQSHYSTKISQKQTEALFLTFFFYSALTEVEFASMAGYDDLENVHHLLTSNKKGKKKSSNHGPIGAPRRNELGEICKILFSMFQSMGQQRKRIFALMLDSLDIICLERLYEKCQCSFKFNAENFVTEADPQKMMLIAFSVLRGVEARELRELFAERYQDLGVIDVKAPGQGKIF